MESIDKNYSKSKSRISSIFRQNDKDTEIDNFQLANMRHKIKRAKKAKSNNYKNIETFETITNDASSPSMGIPDLSSNYVDPPKPVQEGFTNDEYEGWDTVKESTQKISFNPGTWVEFVYEFLTKINTIIATKISKALSGGHSNENDMKEIRNYISLLESVWVSTYIVYNWYYLMYYAPENATKIMSISRADFKSNDTPGNKVLMFFFEYAIVLVETLNYIIMDFIPKKIGVYLNGSTNFSLLFLTILYCVKNFAIGFKTFLTDSLRFNLSSGGAAGLITLYVIGQFIYTLINDSIKSKNDPNWPKPLIMRIFEMGMLFTPVALILVIIYYIIRLVLVMLISVPVGGILSGLYLIFYSFFGKWWYSSNTTYKDLDAHATKSSSIKMDPCNDDTSTKWFKTVLLSMFSLFDGIKTNLFPMVLLFVIMFSSSRLYTTLSNVRSFIPGILFRDIIGMYNGIMILTVFSILYSSIKKGWKKDDSST